ncbi:hypothetical protein MicvaDRAFT_4178 [Microcoleus vaginatus FGP-2]|nr:hypothetical protein MicvaDRAFT_4178 [Microcoleus vaginatus FGP-2]
MYNLTINLEISQMKVQLVESLILSYVWQPTSNYGA